MANERQTLSHLANQVRMGMSRASCRDFDDNHLMQQITYADVYHSETPSDFERWQMVGITATPLPQDQDQQQQTSKTQQGQGADNQGDWNHNQPQGDAAEAVMLYLNGSRSHPVALVDDRRVRPYLVPSGGAAFYAPTGTGQMAYHNDQGSYLIATDNPKYSGSQSGGGGSSGGQQQQTPRFASLRHVNKKPQDRKPSSDSGSNGGGSSAGTQASVSTRDASSGGGSSSSQQTYQHEGESVNTEVRCTSSTIEFWAGGSKIGYYDTSGSKWSFTGEMHLGDDSADHPIYGVNNGKGMTTLASGVGAVLVDAPNPGPPTSMDQAPLVKDDLTLRIDALEERLARIEEDRRRG